MRIFSLCVSIKIHKQNILHAVFVSYDQEPHSRTTPYHWHLNRFVAKVPVHMVIDVLILQQFGDLDHMWEKQWIDHIMSWWWGPAEAAINMHQSVQKGYAPI